VSSQAFIRKTKTLAQLHNIFANEELFWLQRLMRDGYFLMIITLLIFIEWLMAGKIMRTLI
jgi:hypothetical protein